MSRSEGSDASVSKKEILRCVTPIALARSVCVSGGSFAHLKFFRFLPKDIAKTSLQTEKYLQQNTLKRSILHIYKAIVSYRNCNLQVQKAGKK